MNVPLTAVVCVGDAVVDRVQSRHTSNSFAGGGALNVAVAVRRLGMPSALLADIGWDCPGQWLRSYLRTEAVLVLDHPSVNYTGIAISDRTGAEPSYRFSRSYGHMSIRFSAAVMEVIAAAPAIAIDSASLFRDQTQVKALGRALAACHGLRAVDPNPRPQLVVDRLAYVENVEEVLPNVDLLKLSVEDIELLYGKAIEDVVDRVLSLGTHAVFVTRGSQGAAVYAADGAFAEVGVPDLEGRVVDTMAAGDVALAAAVVRALELGMPTSPREWSDILDFSMLVAGLTCRRLGAASAAPAAYELAPLRSCKTGAESA